MKVLKFISSDGSEVYVNPEQVVLVRTANKDQGEYGKTVIYSIAGNWHLDLRPDEVALALGWECS